MLHDFIYSFYDAMLFDKRVAPFLLKSQMAQSQDVYMKLIKDRTIEYLEQVWGGDKWEGQDLFRLHMHLQVNKEVYDRCIKLGTTQCKKMGLSKEVTRDIVHELDIMGEPITDPDGKFRKWVDDKQREMEAKFNDQVGAVDPHGMGFPCSPKFLQQMEDQKKRKQELSERLAAARLKRATEAKDEQKRVKQEALEKEKAKEAKTQEKDKLKQEAASKPKQEDAKKKVKAANSDPTKKAKGDAGATGATPELKAKKSTRHKPSDTPVATQAAKSLSPEITMSTDVGSASTSGEKQEDASMPTLPEDIGFPQTPDSLHTPMPGGVSTVLA